MTEDAILHRRADRLARPERADEHQATMGMAGNRWLVVHVSAGHRAAVPVAEIESVLTLVGGDALDPGAPGIVTPLIGAPPYVVGLLPVQGAIVTVLDLARLLGLDPGNADESYALLIPLARGRVAVRVQQVESLLEPVALDPVPAGAATHVTGLVPGIGPLLALRSLVEDPRWVVDLAL